MIKDNPNSEKRALKVGYHALHIIPKDVYLAPDKHIFLQRRDIVARAISRLFMRTSPKNDQDVLENLYNQKDILEIAHNSVQEEIKRNRYIENFIEEHRLNPYLLFYEDLFSPGGDFKVIQELSRFLEIPIYREFATSQIKPQQSKWKDSLIKKYKFSHFYTHTGEVKPS